MVSPLLQQTVAYVVGRLVSESLLELRGDAAEEVVEAVVNALSNAEPGAQLVSTMTKALLGCPAVEELYATNQQLKDLITEFGSPACQT